MPKVDRTWHSTRPGETVYHNNTSCTTGDNIEQRNLAPGMDGRRLCDECAKLNKEGKQNLLALLREEYKLPKRLLWFAVKDAAQRPQVQAWVAKSYAERSKTFVTLALESNRWLFMSGRKQGSDAAGYQSHRYAPSGYNRQYDYGYTPRYESEEPSSSTIAEVATGTQNAVGQAADLAE